MRIKITGFTDKGRELCEKIKDSVSGKEYKTAAGSDAETVACVLRTIEESLEDFTKDGFANYDALVYVGACGIAVRAIAPFVKDKLSDIPVLVISEDGAYTIPVLSGHMGGANRLAEWIANAIRSDAVITTATDLRGVFAVDVFAKDNNLWIENREGIEAVSSKVLAGKEITISVESDSFDGELPDDIRQIPYDANEYADILISQDLQRTNGLIRLRPKNLVLGIGCRKDKPLEEIEAFADAVLKKNGLLKEQVFAMASIDRKKDEEGLLQYAKKLRIPFYTFTADELNAVEGEFDSSEFVKETVGVDNVCERSAMAAAGTGAELILSKQSGDGITVAVAKKRFQIGLTELKDRTEPVLYVVGMGPGKEEGMTLEALRVLEESDAIIGYTVYLDLLPERLKKKELISTPMRQEKERCRIAFEEAGKGKKVSVICSGDAGIYGMASLLFEMRDLYPSIEIRVIPGVTAASAGAALLGAPLNHDFCTVSLSDLLTPSDIIRNRLIHAAQGDFNIVIYNPSSHKRKEHLKKACEILLEYYDENRPCGYVRNIGREDCSITYCTLKELASSETDMFTTVFIGSSQTEYKDGKLFTKRGYRINENTDICGNN